MRNNLTRRAAALALALLAALSLAGPAAAEEDGGTVRIRSAEDFLAFAENCAYDLWSADKSVVLERNISLSGVDYLPAASFGGSFDGGGHTISGLAVSAAVAPAGLFGEIRSGGSVKNLRVEGAVTPSGSGEQTGGIAGINRGTITECSFSGTVSGVGETGGICGRNESGGLVRGCRSTGGVYGKRMTGGVAGNNSGLISVCTNQAYVNTNTLDPTITLSELNLDLEEGLRRLASPDTYNVATDSGGIAGHSDGTLSSCRNLGTVGYQHIGYNVGGIAGRSSGRISGCVNSGEVYGRKDVGGVAGIAEPYIRLQLGAGSLEAVRAELDSLSAMVDRAAEDASGVSQTVSARLVAIGDSVGAAERRARDLSGDLGDRYDAAAADLNSGAETLRGSLPLLSETAADLTASAAELSEALEALDRASAVPESADVSGKTGAGRADLQRAEAILEEGLAQLRSARGKLDDALESADSLTPEELTRRFSGYEDDTGAHVNGVLDDLRSGLDLIANGRPGDEGGVAFYYSRAARELSEGLEALGGAVPELDEALEGSAASAEKLTEAMNDTQALLRYFGGTEGPRLPVLGQETDARADALYDALRDVSDQLDLLNGELLDSSDALTGDVKRINRQFTALMYAMLGMVEDVEDAELNDRVEDTSEADIDAATDGKIQRCSNEGAVRGDINVGGVAGSMSVYNELDPERAESVSLSTAIRRTYELKCILLDCANYGSVEGKRSCVGAVCGDAQLGAISACLACGEAGSADGDYVGGIAGRGSSLIRGCWARCGLSGQRYVGGVVGGAASGGSLRVTDCRSLVEIRSAAQYAGAVSGSEEGDFRGNLFVSDALSGLNRVSVQGAAEPVSYAALTAAEDLPKEFRSFTLRFTAGGETLLSLPFSYGDSFDASVFPELPRREGQYARWDREELNNLRFDTTVTAVYAPSVTALPSAVTRAAARPAFFVLGSFTDRQTLEARSVIMDFSPEHETLWQTLRAYRRTRLEQWELTLPEDGADAHILRYLPPKTASGALELFYSDGGNWVRAETETAGSYLCFTAPGESVYLTVVSAATPWWVWTLLTVFLLNAAALVILLLLRKKPAPGADAAEREKAERFRRRRRRALAVLVAAAAALGLASGAVLLLAPEISSLELYTLLRSYDEQAAVDLELSLSLRGGDRDYAASAAVWAEERDGERFSCMDWQGLHILRRNGAAELADGTPLPGTEIPADYTLFPGAAAGLIRALDLDASESDGAAVYRAETADRAVMEGLDPYLPPFGAIHPELLRLELTVTDGEPESLRAVWTAGAETAEARVDFRAAAASHTLPPAERTGEQAPPEGLTGSWLELLSREQLGATVTRKLDCGPLAVDETMEWQRSVAEGTELSRLTRRGEALLFTDSAACTAAGRPIDRGDPSLTDLAALLRLSCAAVLSGSAETAEEGSGWTLEIPLNGDAVPALAAVLAPEAEAGGAEMTEGSILVRLSEGRIIALRLACSGVTRVVRADVPVSASVELRFSEQTAFPPLDRDQKTALGLN